VNFLNTPDQAVVSWTTACSSDTTVQYGATPGGLTNSASGNQTQYTFPGDSYTSPFIHHTVLSGLTTATTVFYRVGGSASGYSGVMNFTTHPGVGPAVYTRYAIIGDLGQTSNSADTLAHIAAAAYPFTSIMHVGDLSYADNDEPRWDSWQNLVAYMSQVSAPQGEGGGRGHAAHVPPVALWCSTCRG
jgi:acid phosphatase type 7